jgi:histone H2A
VPQGSVLGPVLYLLYTSDLPILESSTVATFADDTAILAIGSSSNEESTEKLQTAINQIQKWTKKMEHPA